MYAIIEIAGPSVLSVHETTEEADIALNGFTAEGRKVIVSPVQGRQPVVGIQAPAALLAFVQQYKPRRDWHEPDEQGLNARIFGTHLDNAMGASMCAEGKEHAEFNVVLTHRDDAAGAIQRDVAVINLANLLAWATGYARMIEDAESRGL